MGVYVVGKDSWKSITRLRERGVISRQEIINPQIYLPMVSRFLSTNGPWRQLNVISRCRYWAIIFCLNTWLMFFQIIWEMNQSNHFYLKFNFFVEIEKKMFLKCSSNESSGIPPFKNVNVSFSQWIVYWICRFRKVSTHSDYKIMLYNIV